MKLPPMKRPICACCGKAYGHRIVKRQRQVVEIGQPIPRYTGNAILISETRWPEPPVGRPDTPENATAYVPMDKIAGARISPHYTGRKGREITWVTWDGESIGGGYDPFCTLRCALIFARAAHRAGYRAAASGDTDALLSD